MYILASDYRTGKTGTALNNAVLLGNAEVARCLLEHGTDVQLATVHAYTQGTHTMRDFLNQIERVHNKIIVRPRDESLQQFRHKFVQQYQLLRDAGKLSHTKLRASCLWFQNYRHAWQAGISTMRRLSHGKTTPYLWDILAFLMLAKAITETLQARKKWYYTNNFNCDLPRWRTLLDNTADLEAYRDVVWRMWTIELPQILNSDETCPGIIQFLEELSRILVSRMQDMLDIDFPMATDSTKASADGVSEKNCHYCQNGRALQHWVAPAWTREY
jgi:hypothetical protein